MGLRAWIKTKMERRGKEGYGNFKPWFEPHNMFTRKSDYQLANNEIIFAAITKLSNTMASLPLKLYRNLEHQPSHQLDYLLSVSPNPNMTSLGFIQTMEVMRNTFGNAYAMKNYDKNMVVESLHILNPALVEPAIEENTKELYYRINAPGGVYHVHNHEMIHVRHISMEYKGISPIDVLRNTINFDNQIRTINLNQMNNAIKASFVLKVGANLDREKKEALKAQFEEFYSKNGGVIIIESGYSLDPVKSDFIDTKLFEAEKITRSRVALVFGIPGYKFGEETRAGNEEQAIGFVQDALLPVVRQYEQEFNRKLLSPAEHQKGYTFKFNIGGLLRADTKTRADFYFKGIRSGFLTPNEARAWEELPSLPGGDRLLSSRDLQPLEAVEGREEK
jgi:HK97 family phage portal protein